MARICYPRTRLPVAFPLCLGQLWLLHHLAQPVDTWWARFMDGAEDARNNHALGWIIHSFSFLIPAMSKIADCLNDAIHMLARTIQALDYKAGEAPSSSQSIYVLTLLPSPSCLLCTQMCISNIRNQYPYWPLHCAQNLRLEPSSVLGGFCYTICSCGASEQPCTIHCHLVVSIYFVVEYIYIILYGISLLKWDKTFIKQMKLLIVLFRIS